ncbi:pyridoxamine 5'-phosphate oxidase family protein [Halovivax sp.]|uniref:pyridoxamine 5'-phosphate oxidase family protein n=1 Tax=Halovivax sp. TaxID=1935978 RepID=UPI0025BC3F97|nr:pyridoxamine 5'-phosphate oxidase family protein [Halovivax sp.]
MHVRGSLTDDEISRFLSERTIPIRLGCRTPSGHPWMLSMWYRYRADGEDGSDDWTLDCATAEGAKVVGYLREDPALSFEVSTNDPPYAGVRGRGTATIEADPEKETLRDLLDRYLGGTDSELARNLLREDREEVTISIEPAVVYGWDFSDRTGAGG